MHTSNRNIEIQSIQISKSLDITVWTSEGILYEHGAIFICPLISVYLTVYSSAFRGRPLKGVKIDVPQGYTGNFPSPHRGEVHK